MQCTTGDPESDPLGFIKFLGDPIGTIINQLAGSILESAVSLFSSLTQSVDTLPKGDGTAAALASETQSIVVLIAVASLLFAAIRLALERRGEAGTAAMKGVLRVVVVAGLATAVATTLANLSDRFAASLFAKANMQKFTETTCGGKNGFDGIPSFLLLVLAFLLLIAALINVIMMFVRLGVMVLLLGTLPLAAAASMTDWGAGWWRKHIGWMVAWLLFKPAVALIIFSGVSLLGRNGGGDLQSSVAGFGIMLLSATALPALLKLVVPATAALGNTSASSSPTMDAAGGLASGAKSIGGGGGSPGGAGPSGASGPSGGSGAAGGMGKAGAAAGAAGGVVGAAVAVAKGAERVARSGIDGADGDAGHNR